MSRWDVRQTWENLNKIRLIWITLIVLFVIGMFVLFIELLKNSDSHVLDALPCPYLDSIDLTGGERQTDGSFKFNNITYSEDLYAKVDFVLNYDSNGKPFYKNVEPYYRGCICNITTCMFLCYTGDGAKNCKANISNEAVKQELDEEFQYNLQYINEKLCSDENAIELEEGEYNMTDGEAIDAEGDSLSFFVTYDVESKEKLFFQCEEIEEKELHIIILPYFMFVSVAFIIATFCVYVYLPELRNLHGKCLLCYLLCLAFGFSFMGWLHVNDDQYVEPNFCLFSGYFMYFAFQSAFFWLNVICFDLWWNFRRTRGFVLSERKRFMFYTIYAWGAAIFLTLLIFILDQIESVPMYLRPGIGDPNCFLATDFLRRFLYVYLPLLILCTLNIVFFTLTTLTIRQLQIEVKKIVSKDESRKNQKKLRKDKDNVTLFLRLFIVMGVGWITEAISFLYDPKCIYFFVFDIWNCSAGISIFICMVVKRRVFQLMKRRWHGVFGRSLSTEDAATYSSSVTGDPRANMRLQRLTSNISATRNIH